MKYFIYILTVFFLSSCASIKKYDTKNLKPLKEVSAINGTYKNFIDGSLLLQHKSLNGLLNWRKKHKDTTKFESVKITTLSNKKLKLDFVKNETLLKTRIINYRLKNNGFLKLKNSNFRISGIPYIFGEYDVVKLKLGLTKENNLIVNGYKESAGGILIVLSSGYAFDINQIHKRIFE